MAKAKAEAKQEVVIALAVIENRITVYEQQHASHIESAHRLAGAIAALKELRELAAKKVAESGTEA